MLKASLVALSTLLFAPAAMADESEVWEGVYERSGKTITIGKWMGVGGGVAGAGGLVFMVTGGMQALGGTIGTISGEGGSEDVGAGTGKMIVGYGLTLGGLASFATGTAVMAAGSIRQAKAIRMVNPEAALPWYGYATWGLFGLEVASFPVGTVPLAGLGYLAASLQAGKNAMNWDRSTAKRLNQSRPSTFTVDLAPFQYEGNKGLALVGTF